MALKLDIGGTIFKTSRSTLTKYDSMFKRMLESGVPLETDESGSIFIDRDPTHFRYILNFLRDGTVELRKDPKEVQEILKEAEYYLIQELIDFCKNHQFIELETSKWDYRVVRNSAELREILIEATRGVYVITYPCRIFDNGDNHSIIQQLAQKHKDKVDIVLIENPNKGANTWSYVYFPWDRPSEPKNASGEAYNFYEIIASVDQHLSSL